MTIKALLVLLAALPTWREDRFDCPDKLAQRNGIAAAVQAEARTPDEAAFLLAWGQHESAFSLRIGAGRCKPWECDRGRARGPWQLHRDASMTADTWSRMHGLENVPVQAREAAKKVRWALRQCPADRVRGGFRVLGGNGCQKALRGEDERVRTFQKIRKRM